MDIAAIEALAATAGTALVTAAVTDLFEDVRHRVARLFGRGQADPAISGQLTATWARLAGGLSVAEAERARADEAAAWQARFRQLLTERPEAAAEVRALIEEIRVPSPVSGDAAGHSITAGRDVHIAADRGSVAAGIIHGDVTITDRTAGLTAKIDAARDEVRRWGRQLARGEWDWYSLGHALQYAHEAIELDPESQRAWTMLADIYHRIGERELAEFCLRRSLVLARPGPNWPGHFYNEVKRNLETGYPFNESGNARRPQPPAWFAARYQRYLNQGRLEAAQGTNR